MLNQATAAFEHAVIAPLVVLNGGAVVAFLTLIGAVADSKSSLSPDAGWVAAATVSWALGLIAAALAATYGFRRQQAISVAHRLQRQELEKHFLGAGSAVAKIVIVPPDSGVSRKTKRDDAEKFWGRFQKAWWASIVCFVAGAAAALPAVL